MSREPGAMARTILGAYMTGKAVADQLAEKVKVEVKPMPAMRTYVDRRTNVRLPVILFDEVGTGVLKELVLRSNLSGYKVIINADGSEIYNNTWDWFYDRSQIIDEIAAFQDNSNYILTVSDIKFSNRLKISIRPVEPVIQIIRLTEVFLKVDIT